MTIISSKEPFKTIVITIITDVFIECRYISGQASFNGNDLL